MWTKTHSVLTKEVSKDQMWKLISDVNHWHDWDHGIEYATLSGEFIPGSRIILKPKAGPKVDIKIMEATKGKRFMDATQFPLATMYLDHEYEETSEGLKCTQTISVKGLLSFLWVKIVAQNLANSLPSDMEAQIRAARKL
jgi:hypothetical protein